VHKPGGRALNDAQKEILTKWIAQGAGYQGHWAFEPPVRPSVPKMKDADSNLSNPIDFFIRSRLHREGIPPAREANKPTLIRRATLDLTGLPPTMKEIQDFLADDSPDAYEKVVDRLLHSPRYGERMALTWMDYARYADSNGFQSDGSRAIWAWRDWVINAYNANIPFDQFTIEQLAGDMLPNATRDQIIATGFNRNHRLNGEGGRIEAEWFVETVIDRVETTGLTWLGLTFNCCRCHDHKYDPISQKEFYSMFAYFNSNNETGVLAAKGKEGENTPPLLSLATPEQEKQLALLEASMAKAKSKLSAAGKQLPQRQRKWEESLASDETRSDANWDTLKIESASSAGGATLTKQDDESVLASGDNPSADTYTIIGDLKTTKLTALMIEVFPDPSMPNQSLGRASNGNFVLSQVTAQIEAPGLETPLEVTFTQAEADYEQKGWPAKSVIVPESERKKGTRLGWAVDGNDPAKRLPRRLVLRANKVNAIPQDAKLHVALKHSAGIAQHSIGRFRISTTEAAPESTSIHRQSATSSINKIVTISADQRTDKQKKELEEYFKKEVDNDYQEADKAFQAAKKKHEDFQQKIPSTMVMNETSPREAFVLMRGEYDKPVEKVNRTVPAVFMKASQAPPADRLELARWIASHDNPLTARVWVNREWERFFGVGLVKTTENFGAQAEFPSHPELLDWLACEFMEPTSTEGQPNAINRWDMKALQKRIVMSQTYRQQSRVDADLMKRDPENRLLARAPRLRQTGEILRDSALFISGLLVDKIGGPSVRPYMPEGVWDETSKYGNLRNYKPDSGEGLYRRTMYTIWKRTAAPPSMLIFDAPNRETCSVKRSRTNTPLQALSLLNEITFVEAARHFGARMIREGGDTDRDRIQFGFRLAIARHPTDREIDILMNGLANDIDRYRLQTEDAEKLIKLGDSPMISDLDPATHAAYTLLANVLLNLDEFITRE
jgi:hypothetical protein